MLVNKGYYGSTNILKNPICEKFHELILSNLNETNHLHESNALTEIEHNNICPFSSPEPKAPGQLIGWEASVVLRRPSTLSNDFSSETTGPNVSKFHM